METASRRLLGLFLLDSRGRDISTNKSLLWYMQLQSRSIGFIRSLFRPTFRFLSSRSGEDLQSTRPEQRVPPPQEPLGENSFHSSRPHGRDDPAATSARKRVLDAALRHVASRGWMDALGSGAQECGCVLPVPLPSNFPTILS